MTTRLVRSAHRASMAVTGEPGCRWTRGLWSAVGVAVCGIAGGCMPTVQSGTVATPAAAGEVHVWTLATADTAVTIGRSGDDLRLLALRNPAQQWNWVAAPSSVPMPELQGADGPLTLRWTFKDATEDGSHGDRLTLRFDCAQPELEMTSVWEALPGPVPVENEVTVENRSPGPVTYAPTAAAQVAMVSDDTVTLQRADKTAVGVGRVYRDVLASDGTWVAGTSKFPLVFLDSGRLHGAYVGYEWEIGNISIATGADPRRPTATARPLTEAVTRGPGARFAIPAVYFGTYQGDVDDGANTFKRWFWNYKIPRTLHDHSDEPWVEVCIANPGSNGPSGTTAQAVYDALAAEGAECVKADFWDGSNDCWYTDRDWQFHPQVWPNGFDFAIKAHQAGLKASLYMGGTYRDADLNTDAGRDAELAAVLARYDLGWFDMWRTDRYIAPEDPLPETYEGVANFLSIQDQLIGARPGYRYENCCNGGKWKGFAIARRMTFCTMNDSDHTPWQTRSTYYSDSFAINPVQLKSDCGPVANGYQMRTSLLGAMLSGEGTDAYREHVPLYKVRQRPILRGAYVYHILPMANGVDWDGLQYLNPELGEGSLFLFKGSATSADGDAKTIFLKGLDPAATYTLEFQDRKEQSGTRSGAQLMFDGLRVTGMGGDEASEIIWIHGPKGDTSMAAMAERRRRLPPAGAPQITPDVDALATPGNPAVIARSDQLPGMHADPAEWWHISALAAPFAHRSAGMVKMVWADDGLHGFVQVPCPAMTVDPVNPWKGDCLEIFLDRTCLRDDEKDAGCSQIIIAPAPGAPGKAIIVVPYQTLDGIQAVWQPVPGGYTLEFLLPAKTLAPARMVPGTRMGFNYAIDHAGKSLEQFFSDKDVDGGYANPSTWGVIELAK